MSKRKTCTEDEKQAVRRQLGKFLDLDRLPGKHNIIEAQRKEVVIQNKPWTHMKLYKSFLQKKVCTLGITTLQPRSTRQLYSTYTVYMFIIRNKMR